MKISLIGSLLLAGFLIGFTSDPSEGAAQRGMWRDFDGDGYTEALVFTIDNRIDKVMLDTNDDGKTEVIVYYKNGYRDHGTGDMDHDGKIDTWIKYYFTGAPWMIARDRNGDQEPDYWEYLKEDLVYRWDLDRNFDGKVDFRTVIFVDESRGGREGKEFSKRWYDNNFDGMFDRVATGVSRKEPSAFSQLIG